MRRFAISASALLLLAACDVTPQSVTVCENISIRPALHDAESYDRLHYRIVASSDNTVDVQITFSVQDAEGRTFKRTEKCNFPRDAANNEQEARAYLQEQKREKVESGKRETRSVEELQQKYHERMETRTERLLQAEDDEGKAILRELQELMTIDKKGYEDGAAKPAE